ncbi:MAG: tetratricopeptide repeat protein, partial [Candidatus Hermodarchaeota archaeon]
TLDDQIPTTRFEEFASRTIHNLNEFTNPNLSEEFLATLDVKNRFELKKKDYDDLFEFHGFVSDEKIWVSLGAFYQMQMKYEKAYKCYKNALKISENYVIPKINVELIEKLAQKQIVTKPIDYFNKGIVFCGQNRLEEAIQSFDKALKLDPNYKLAWYYKALTLNQLGRFEEAVHFYNKALVLDPNYKDAWNSKGISLARSGRHKEALQAYENAIEIDPNYKDAWNNKGIELERLGKLEEALQAYDRIIKLDPYFILAWKNKELALKQAGRNEEAQKVHNQAIKLGVYDQNEK